MKNRLRAFTLIELLVVVVVIGILFGLLLPMLGRAREENRKNSCKENLSLIGKAEVVYYQDFNECLSFAWGPATSSGNPCANPTTGAFTPGVAATMDCCDAATSIGILYPFLGSAKYFRCPSTQDDPSYLIVAPYLPGTATPATAANAYLFSQRTWSLVSRNPEKGWGASYGYDCRISPSAVGSHAIAGDMAVTWQGKRRLSAANHADGENILYVDGSVRWMATTYASNDPVDNIYCEGGQSRPGGTTDFWCADTDSFLVRGSVVLGASWNEYTQIQQ